MKKIIVVLLLVVGVASSLVVINRFVSPRKGTVDTVFLGPNEYKSTFDEATGSAKEFYDLYGKARESVNSRQYDTAIKLLNESLTHIGIGLEKGMVYKKLAGIYRMQGNLEKELYYTEEYPKYSMNQQLNEEAKQRASGIRQALSRKK